jgi:hypothetical protein
LDELDPRVSGTGRTGLWSHLGDDQDLKQGGNAPDVSRDDQEGFGNGWMLFGNRIKTRTYAVKILGFPQDLSRRHCLPDFIRA